MGNGYGAKSVSRELLAAEPPAAKSIGRELLAAEPPAANSGASEIHLQAVDKTIGVFP